MSVYPNLNPNRYVAILPTFPITCSVEEWESTAVMGSWVREWDKARE